MLLKEKMWKTVLDILFPKHCLNCYKKGTYLCDDCKALINISNRYETGVDYLDYLFWAGPYKDRIIKACLYAFNQKYVKELANELSDLIITYIRLMDNCPILKKQLSIIPMPISKKKLKKQGFNPSYEIALQISKKLNIPFGKDKTILLINDIYVPEMQEYAKKLKQKTSQEVWGLVVARQ